MRISDKQIASVTALNAAQRYKHFIKIVTDWEQVWGLNQDGWALAEADDGVNVFPLWPAKEYAELCAKDHWAGYKPQPISLDDLLNELLPKLSSDEMLPCIFYTPSNKGVTPTVEQLRVDIAEELGRYE